MAAKLLKSYELQVMICDLLKITSICYVFTGGKTIKTRSPTFNFVIVFMLLIFALLSY
jgi:hypothetical protein